MADDTPVLNPTPPAVMGDGAGGPTEPPAARGFMDAHLDQAQARFSAMKKEVARIGSIRKGLDALGKLGDTVTSDDVLDEMADLVAHGADPKMFAAMMAGNAGQGLQPMPPQGEALAQWLGKVSTDLLAPYEAQLKPAMALAQHQLGVAALHKMVDLHAKAGASGAQPPAPAPTNAPPSLLQ